MLRTVAASLAALLSLGLAIASNGQQAKERVYVWDFVDNNGRQTDLTERLTSEFEEVLTQGKCYQVLERRRFDRLLAHIKNEKAIADLNGISKSSMGEIQKITNAQMVVFGKVDDDVESGQIQVTVSLQHFDSSKEVKSVRMRRGQRFDAESRETAMKKLVGEICGSLGTNPILGKYTLVRDGSSYIELKPDGTIFFSFVQYGKALQGVGTYSIEDKQISVKSDIGLAARGIIDNDKISFENGDVFARSKGAITPPNIPSIGIAQATFARSPRDNVVPSQLIISGYGWDGGSEVKVVVNGRDISNRIVSQTGSIVFLKGTSTDLNIQAGKNEVVVVVGGTRSNPYLFKEAMN
jgi:phosphoribosylformylglycinamidine (FGAM) synthase PurS component